MQKSNIRPSNSGYISGAFPVIIDEKTLKKKRIYALIQWIDILEIITRSEIIIFANKN